MKNRELTYYLFRHGETKWNEAQKNKMSKYASKKEFTDIGISQIDIISNKINELALEAIFTSDIIRTKKTTEIISKNNNIPIYFFKELRELDTGIYKKLPKKKFLNQEEIIRAFKDYNYVIPSGESINNLISRSYKALDKIRDLYNYNRVALITHCSVISNVVEDMLNIEYKDIDFCIIKYTNNKYSIVEYGNYDT